mmetsp:Transcript_12783/g.36695  ORF Transcript_12783/g.36695 Transcript_12783/m.36695 type:complete len:242 (+) Transcript_12783:1990-2715(+)
MASARLLLDFFKEVIPEDDTRERAKLKSSLISCFLRTCIPSTSGTNRVLVRRSSSLSDSRKETPKAVGEESFTRPISSRASTAENFSSPELASLSVLRPRVLYGSSFEVAESSAACSPSDLLSEAPVLVSYNDPRSLLSSASSCSLIKPDSELSALSSAAGVSSTVSVGSALSSCGRSTASFISSSWLVGWASFATGSSTSSGGVTASAGSSSGTGSEGTAVSSSSGLTSEAGGTTSSTPV